MVHRLWKRTALTTALLFSMPVHAQSLEQAVANVLASHPDMGQAFHRYQELQVQHQSAKGGFLPSLELQAGIGREHTRNEGSEHTDLTRKELSLSLRQMLFDGFKTAANSKRTAFEAQAEHYALQAAAENMALRVAEVYLGVLKEQQFLNLAEQNLETHRRIFSDIEKKHQAGAGTSADLTQAQGRLARAESNVLAARNNYRDAETKFIRVVDTLPKDLVVPVSDWDMLPQTEDQALEWATEQHPILRSADLDVQAAGAQHQGAESGLYPSVTFEVDKTWNENLDGIERKSRDLVAMVRLRYNLFNGGRDQDAAYIAAHQAAQAKNIRESSYRQLKEGVRLSWNAKAILSQQRQLQQKHVESAYQTVQSYNKQFQLGSRTLLDLLNTENELFEARRSFIASEMDELLAEYRLLNATGQLLAALRVTTPEAWEMEGDE